MNKKHPVPLNKTEYFLLLLSTGGGFYDRIRKMYGWNEF